MISILAINYFENKSKTIYYIFISKHRLQTLIYMEITKMAYDMVIS